MLKNKVKLGSVAMLTLILVFAVSTMSAFFMITAQELAPTFTYNTALEKNQDKNALLTLPRAQAELNGTRVQATHTLTFPAADRAVIKR